jgi:hypothetical protein
MTNGQMYETPAFYQIRVKGTLDQSWSDWFGSLTITQKTARPSWPGR